MLTEEEKIELYHRYGDDCLHLYASNCFALMFSEHVTLFVGQSESRTQAIISINGIDKEVSMYYHSILQFCNLFEERYSIDQEMEITSSYSCPEVIEPESEISQRNLVIMTWGNSVRKHKPERSQLNFNVVPIVTLDRGTGLNLKKLNGTNREIQECLFQNPKFNLFVENIVSTVESNSSIHSISINCKNGIHRSVAVAEILKKEFFPNATIVHLELGHSHKR